jgi:chemotaxis response regulator CheB
MRTRGTSGRDIIVVGASAGGVEPVMQVIEQLPAGLEASVFVVRDGARTTRGNRGEPITSKNTPLTK